jgi:mono/diheme cytochrome c family protein
MSFLRSLTFKRAAPIVPGNSIVRAAARAIALFTFLGCLTSIVMGAITAEQRKQLKELNDGAREAGRLFNEGKFVESAEKVTEIQAGLVKLLETKDAELQKETRRLYSILQTAHGRLELEGAELEPLPAWEELTEGKPTVAATISFKDDIAPWMIAQCGNCHINKRSGDFSIATFNDLLKGSKAGKVLFAGSDKDNPLVEVIENGEMPQGGGEVSKENIEKLRKWIAEGAKFDGPNPAAPVNSYAKSAAATAQAEMTPKKPTGGETVSFARDIAPLLVENCKGCHIAGRQAQANFRMDTFTQLLRGGDSGQVIVSEKPDASLIVKKLKGEGDGQRMPAGRPALSPEKIELVSTWIREGAAFDGSSPASNIETVINEAWAAGAKHEELFARRQERALARWSKVLPNDEPATAKSEQVFVLGNVPKGRVEELVKQLDKAIASVAKSLDAPSNQPLVKGGIALFVLKSRYDYGEFGRMTESRELPREWQGHWKADPLDVYTVMANDSSADAKQQSALAVQMVSGAYLGSFNEVPTWFAEGVARNLVVAANRTTDARVRAWQQSLPAAIQKIDKPETLLEDRVDEESAGLVGMALTSYMMERSRRRQFDALLKQLREGKSFTEAVTMTFAPPKSIVKNFIGK